MTTRPPETPNFQSPNPLPPGWSPSTGRPYFPSAPPAPPQPPPKKDHTLPIVFAIVGGILLALVMLGSCVAALSSAPAPVSSTVSAGPVERSEIGSGNTTEPTTTEPTTEAPKATKAPKPKPTQKAMTRSQEQAVGSAQDYLDYSAFSRKGLIEQLHSKAGEGFSKADAIFAVDHIRVSWNHQAARSAKEYLAYSHFSRSGLIEQLESDAGEGFTHSQAVYGVNKAGL